MEAIDLAALLETEAIKRLKYSYMRCVDLKRWDELTSLFLPEATCAYGDGRFRHEGRDAIVGWLRSAMDRDGIHSSHTVHHPEITLEGDDAASGTWALVDCVIDTDHEVQVSGSAYYHDRYRKRGGEWQIEHTGYERVFERVESLRDRPGWKLTASMWQSGDDRPARS
jgi:hypothetical protein